MSESSGLNARDIVATDGGIRLAPFLVILWVVIIDEENKVVLSMMGRTHFIKYEELEEGATKTRKVGVASEDLFAEHLRAFEGRRRV